MALYRYPETERRILEESPVPFAVYQGEDGRVSTLILSQGFLDMRGETDREAAYADMNSHMFSALHPDDAPLVAEVTKQFAADDRGLYDVVYRRETKEGFRIFHAKGKHFHTDTGERLSIVWYTDEGAYDVDSKGGLTEALSNVLHEETIYVRANYDALTGLPSMTYFFRLADAGRKKLKEQGRKGALLFLDLNGMRYYNEKLGFAEGDKLIRSFAKLLLDFFDAEECSRFGQDHFAAFTDTEGLEEKLYSLFDRCREFGTFRPLTVRIGIYLDEDELLDVGTACDRAKAACDKDSEQYEYASHFCYFDEEMGEELEWKQYIIDNLDRAIQEKWIKVYYQPIVRAANGCVSDEEALARWIDPVKGFLSPADFIPILEESKMIYKLDLFMLEQIIDKMKEQERAGLFVVPVSLNLSRADFDSCDIVSEIVRRTDWSGIDRSKLTIEITESVIGRDFEFMKQQILRFQELGFHVWMDDFGSGYSSLDLLQNIRFDLIKFDMSFMKRFDEGEESRIILTELIKMAIGLGIDTVSEGVETKEQMEFLREVGCTKLQGFYFTKPIPQEEIFERYEKGIAIGFENPAESDYYAAIGRINLYDLAVVANEDAETFSRYFDTLPMAIIEVNGSSMMVTRCNSSYREFLERNSEGAQIEVPLEAERRVQEPGGGFFKAILECAASGNREAVYERMGNGMMAHSLIRRIAVNPVTGVTACAVVILSLTDERSGMNQVTYAHVAQVLSADYYNLYYVDLETEDFIEYSPDLYHEDLDVERHGKEFFKTSQKDALKKIYEADREAFIQTFTKERILQVIDEHGTFTLTYRLLIGGEPNYMNMKAVRMYRDPRHLIIGVNNVNAQMVQQEALERVKEERITYARINALSGDYICIYTVNPETGEYTEYNATEEYEEFGLEKTGKDFFASTLKESQWAVFPEDKERYYSMFTKENVLASIRENGVFALNYRLLFGGRPTYVCLKAAMVEEKDGPQLIIGLINTDAQVRRNKEYEYNLSEALSRANVDALTGVKNKHAYIDLETRLNHRIAESESPEFAVIVFDVNDLKLVNDTKGHQAGDQYLMDACTKLCMVFKQSPVFRVGGDEFAVIAQGHDYRELDTLLDKINEDNLREKERGGIVVACGAARYDNDRDVASVFERADAEMYRNKKMLKE